MSLFLVTMVWVAAAPAYGLEIETHQTLSGRTVFIEPEPSQTETALEGGYLAGACNCAMCAALWAKASAAHINAPTPLAELETALRGAELSKDDVLYDLGCGDGRVAILAALEFGARAVGLDRRPEAVELALANARRTGVQDLTRFYAVDDARADLSAATIAYCYRNAAELTPISLRLERLPRLRLAISYRHTWPNGGSQRSGGFWLWRPPAPDQPSESAAPMESEKTYRRRPRCFGRACR